MEDNSGVSSSGNVLRDYFLGHPRIQDATFDRRKVIYLKLMQNSDVMRFVKDIKGKFAKITADYYLRISKEPIDILFSILSQNQEPVRADEAKLPLIAPKEFLFIEKNEKFRLPRDLVFPVAEIHQLNWQPIIITAQQLTCNPFPQKNNVQYEDEIVEEYLSEEHSTMLKVTKAIKKSGKPLRYLINAKYSKVPNDSSVCETEKKNQNASSQAETDQKIDEDSPNLMDICDGDNSSISSYDSGDLKSSSSFRLPLNRSKRQKVTPSPSAASSDSDASTSSMACQDANVSTVDFTVMAAYDEPISSDKLHMDIIIVCLDLDVCRFLSATFGLIWLDDILVELRRSKKKGPKILYTESSAVTDIRTEWKKIIKGPKDGFHKTLRYVQTRMSEGLACGSHNVGITCSEDVRSYTVANVYALLYFDVFSPRCVYNLTLKSLKTNNNRVLESCLALTEIINFSLSFDVSVPCIIKIQGEYFKINVSLLAIIPLYILRAICEHDLTQMMISLRNRVKAPDTSFNILST